MITVTTILAYILGISIILLLLTIATTALLEKFNDLISNLRYSNKLLGKKELANEIQRSSYWFSEDGNSKLLLDLLAKQINENGFVSAEALRVVFRKAVKK